MTDRTGGLAKTRKAHRAAGSRKAVAALSAATTVGLMFAMATAKPAWTSQDTIAVVPIVPDPVVSAPASRSQIVLPVPPPDAGSLVTTTVATTTVAPATPQPVQLDPGVAPARIVTKTVIVRRGGGSASVASSATAPAAAGGSTTTKSSGSR